MMRYQIDASLQQGIPSLRVFDARNGEERLCWQQPVTTDENEMRRAWRALFRRLILLSSYEQAAATREHRPYPVKAARHDQRPIAAEATPSNKTPSHPKQDNVIYLPLKRRSVAR